jgi:hypothetical protein
VVCRHKVSCKYLYKREFAHAFPHNVRQIRAKDGGSRYVREALSHGAGFKFICQGRLTEFPHDFHYRLGNVRGGGDCVVQFGGKEMHNAVGQLAGQKRIWCFQGIRGGEQGAADFVGLEGNKPTVALIDPGGRCGRIGFHQKVTCFLCDAL